MARTIAALPAGPRITDYISLGVINKAFPLAAIGPALEKTGTASLRQRDLPAQVVVYYVIALALYMQSSYGEVLRCLLEGIQWLRDPSAGMRVTGKSGISQARTRLGWEPLRQLHDELVKPVAVRGTQGAWYREWRMKKNMRMACEERLHDGSYLSHVYPSERDWRHKTNGIAVRVIDYRLEEIEGSEPIYRLATTLLDPDKAPASELAALYHERGEIETAFDELKTHLRGSRIVLRSKTPDLVRQEFYGLLMAHFAIRGRMHEAALKAGRDPDQLAFLHAVRVVRRKLAAYSAIPPSEEESISGCRP